MNEAGTPSVPPNESEWKRTAVTAEYESLSPEIIQKNDLYHHVALELRDTNWFTPVEIAQIQAVALGVKPSAFVTKLNIGREDVDRAVSNIKKEINVRCGGEVVLLDFVNQTIFCRIDLVKKRIQEESELAEYAGFDSGAVANPVEFLQKSFPANKFSPELHRLLGFILGFPDSAIRAWDRMQGLISKGVPYLRVLAGFEEYLQMDDAEFENKQEANKSSVPDNERDKLTLYSNYSKIRDMIKRGEITEEQRDLFRRLFAQKEIAEKKTDEMRKHNPGASVRDLMTAEAKINNEFRNEVKVTAEQIYQTFFGVTGEDSRFLTSATLYRLLTPQGEDPVSFLVSNLEEYGGANAPDVKQLEERYTKTFAEVGVGLKSVS